MKSIILFIVVIFSLTLVSCRKTGAELMITPAGLIYVTFGNTQYPYYNFGYIPSRVSVTVGYVNLSPLDETKIPIWDKNGNLLGMANLPSGAGSQMNVAINNIRYYFNNGGTSLPVVVDWYQKWTSAPWEGRIVAY